MGALLTIDVNRAYRDRDPLDTDDRIRRAALDCIARFGLSKTTIDDIARGSGVSRATIYRTFPGGREVLLRSVIVTEIDRFFVELTETVGALDDLEDLVAAGLAASLMFLRDHEALHTIVQMEPGLLLPQFAFHRLDLVLSHAAAFAAPHLEPHVGSAHDARSGAEHLVRIVLSYAMHPSPSVDPSDDASIRRLVRNHIIPGLRSHETARPDNARPEKEEQS